MTVIFDLLLYGKSQFSNPPKPLRDNSERKVSRIGKFYARVEMRKKYKCF